MSKVLTLLETMDIRLTAQIGCRSTNEAPSLREQSCTTEEDTQTDTEMFLPVHTAVSDPALRSVPHQPGY